MDRRELQLVLNKVAVWTKKKVQKKISLRRRTKPGETRAKNRTKYQIRGTMVIEGKDLELPDEHLTGKSMTTITEQNGFFLVQENKKIMVLS
jgi:hypothetical protein